MRSQGFSAVLSPTSTPSRTDQKRGSPRQRVRSGASRSTSPLLSPSVPQAARLARRSKASFAAPRTGTGLGTPPRVEQARALATGEEAAACVRGRAIRDPSTVPSASNSSVQRTRASRECAQRSREPRPPELAPARARAPASPARRGRAPRPPGPGTRGSGRRRGPRGRRCVPTGGGESDGHGEAPSGVPRLCTTPRSRAGPAPGAARADPADRVPALLGDPASARALRAARRSGGARDRPCSCSCASLERRAGTRGGRRVLRRPPRPTPSGKEEMVPPKPSHPAGGGSTSAARRIADFFLVAASGSEALELSASRATPRAGRRAAGRPPASASRSRTRGSRTSSPARACCRPGCGRSSSRRRRPGTSAG